MSKYIPAEKLIAETERWRDKAKEKYNESIYSMGRCDALAEFRNHIISLQQDQPEETCKTCGFYENNCPFIRGKFIPYPNKVCKDYTYSVMKEQPEVDLEKEIRNYNVPFNGWERLTFNTLKEIARHFYKLGLNARKK